MLTEAQKQTIENSLWIVNSVLKKQGIEANADMRQLAEICLIESISRFDESKGVKWTTYAYKTVFLYIKRTYARDCKRENRLVSIEEIRVKGDSVHLTGEIERISDEKSELVQLALKTLTPLERRILSLKTQGYKQQEIKQKCKCPLKTIQEGFKAIKEKFKEVLIGYE